MILLKIMNVNDPKFQAYLRLNKSELNRYVYLREDKEGTYIEYAFKEGAPHDNRCISWYYSLQPNAIRRNCRAFEHDPEYAEKEIEWRRDKIKQHINCLFTLHSFTCGYEEHPEETLRECEQNWYEYHDGEPFIKEEHICKVGFPAPYCIKNKTCAHWTYKEPVKCACWSLTPVDPDNVNFSISGNRLEEYLEILKSIQQ